MEAPEGMLTEEDDVEIHALARRGWSVSAIARHTGRGRKTVRKYLAGPAARGEPPASCLEPFRDYLVARFADDAHVDGTVLYREVVELGFERSYVTFVRQLRLLGLRPRCEACRTGRHGVTVELEHELGEEIQWDWLELRETPWGEPAYVLVGALSFSGRCRAVICEWSSPASVDRGWLGNRSRGWCSESDLVGGCEPRSGEASTVRAKSSVLVVGGREHPERGVPAPAVVERLDVVE